MLRVRLSRRRRSLSNCVALLPVPGAQSAILVAMALPEGGRGRGGEDEDVTDTERVELPGRCGGRGCLVQWRIMIAASNHGHIGEDSDGVVGGAQGRGRRPTGGASGSDPSLASGWRGRSRNDRRVERRVELPPPPVEAAVETVSAAEVLAGVGWRSTARPTAAAGRGV